MTDKQRSIAYPGCLSCNHGIILPLPFYPYPYSIRSYSTHKQIEYQYYGTRALYIRLVFINTRLIYADDMSIVSNKPPCSIIEAERRIYASLNYNIIGSDNGLSPIRHEANADFLLNRSQETWHFISNSNVFIKENALKTSSAKWWQFCICIDLNRHISCITPEVTGQVPPFSSFPNFAELSK